tara:strand:- start:9607 stop:10278 length:672 start_codon:yes stop_codon:yes gene_type:complete
MASSILFVGKKDDQFCDKAVDIIKNNFDSYKILLGDRFDKLPSEIESWEGGDYIISYLSPWVIPVNILKKAKINAINFHPGSPEYPGIGCTNFAIYDQVDNFGVTCHKMNPKVDTGEIIKVIRFSVLPEDTVYSLTMRCYEKIFELFNEIILLICAKSKLYASDEFWKRKPYTRKQLNELCKITVDMPESEIKKRVKAVTFPNAPGAYVELAGIKFKVDDTYV